MNGGGNVINSTAIHLTFSLGPLRSSHWCRIKYARILLKSYERKWQRSQRRLEKASETVIQSKQISLRPLGQPEPKLAMRSSCLPVSLLLPANACGHCAARAQMQHRFQSSSARPEVSNPVSSWKPVRRGFMAMMDLASQPLPVPICKVPHLPH